MINIEDEILNKLINAVAMNYSLPGDDDGLILIRNILSRFAGSVTIFNKNDYLSILKTIFNESTTDELLDILYTIQHIGTTYAELITIINKQIIIVNDNLMDSINTNMRVLAVTSTPQEKKEVKESGVGELMKEIQPYNQVADEDLIMNVLTFIRFTETVTSSYIEELDME